MSKIKVNKKSSFKEDIGGRSVFIDHVPKGSGIELEFVFQGGQKEKHEIVTGSKFQSPDVIIEEIVFYNKGSVDVDVEYHYSSFLIYDEAKTIMTRFDNLTFDGNQYFGGNKQSLDLGIYKMSCLWNPVASSVTAYIGVERLNAYGDDVAFRRMGIDDMVDFVDLNNIVQGLGGANKNMSITDAPQASVWVRSEATVTGDIIGSMSSDFYGTPSSLDFRNAPIAIPPGTGYAVSTVVGNSLSSFYEWIEEAN